MKKLSDLLRGLGAVPGPAGEALVQDLIIDSRQAKPGALFVALQGAQQDGHAFLPQVAAAGGLAALVEKPISAPASLPVVHVPDTHAALAQLAPQVWDYPSKALLMVGITGTNGKTTSSYLLEQVLQQAGLHVGVIGTIEYRFGAHHEPALNTTPYPSELQRFLARIRDGGGEACVMEVSSHALALNRVAGVDFDAALFTNLTQDHLDFHGTMERYAEAKAKLFEGLDPATSKRWPRVAIVNAEDPWTEKLIAHCRVPVITYGFQKGDFRATRIVCEAGGSRFVIERQKQQWPVEIPLLGDYNVANALGVMATAVTLGIAPATILTALHNASGIPGRMEKVTTTQPFTVVVDYAHTEDALRKVMSSLKKLKPRRLIVVFGCGGDRDRAKRPLMGQAAAELADFVWITSDNPRGEDPAKIALDIEVGVRRVRSDQYRMILDRAEAIQTALSQALPNDIVLIAGKGHETYQLVGSQKIAFDDREVARQALSALPSST